MRLHLQLLLVQHALPPPLHRSLAAPAGIRPCTFEKEKIENIQKISNQLRSYEKRHHLSSVMLSVLSLECVKWRCGVARGRHESLIEAQQALQLQRVANQGTW